MAVTDTTPIQERSLARHHRAGVPVVTLLGRESPIRQPLALKQVERLAASLVMDPPGLGKDRQGEQDVVVPIAGIMQLDKPRADHAAVPQPLVEPSPEKEFVSRRHGGG